MSDQIKFEPQDWKYTNNDELEKERLRYYSKMPMGKKLEWLEEMYYFINKVKTAGKGKWAKR